MYGGEGGGGSEPPVSPRPHTGSAPVKRVMNVEFQVFSYPSSIAYFSYQDVCCECLKEPHATHRYNVQINESCERKLVICILYILYIKFNI